MSPEKYLPQAIGLYPVTQKNGHRDNPDVSVMLLGYQLFLMIPPRRCLNETTPDTPFMMSRMPSKSTVTIASLFLVELIIFHGFYDGFFAANKKTIGHDFSWFLPLYVDGYIWFKKNGFFEVPWFTPSFCAGLPAFADPQSAFYSLPQWLSFVVNPLKASYLTLLFSASSGFFGMYILARRCFGLPVTWASYAATLAFFNGFLPSRMMVGEVSYHALNTTPWLLLALLLPVATRMSTIGLGVVAGGLAAYWLQAGIPMLMAPASLGVMLVLLVYRLTHSWPKDLPARVVLAIGFACAFSASKLAASLAFYRKFERTQYSLPGFENLFALLGTNLLALFDSSKAAQAAGSSWLVNAQWAVHPHEWAYGFTMAPLLIPLAGYLIARSRTNNTPKDQNPPENQNNNSSPCTEKYTVFLIGSVLAVPLVLQFYTPAFNVWLKSLPLVGASPWPMRWLIVYLPITPIAAAILGKSVIGAHQDMAPWLAGAGIVATIIFSLSENRDYYANQPYDPLRIITGYQRLVNDGAVNHRIHAVGTLADVNSMDTAANWVRNDALVDGITQARCYNPIFGYRLEKLPPSPLISGEALAEIGGSLNIRNPACYVFPEENACKPGDLFKISQRAQAESFLSYKPYDFKKSRLQSISDTVTTTSCVVAAALIFLVWPWFWWRSGKYTNPDDRMQTKTAP